MLAKPAHEYQDERLRIVPQKLWDAVRARQALRSAELGARIKEGKRHSASRTNAPGSGAPPRYLLSGLLRCGVCGASFVLTNITRYQCASHVNGRACTNRISVKRDLVEDRIVDTIRADLSDPDVIAEVESLVAQIIDPEHHPLYGVVAYYLEAGGPDTGRRPWNLEALAAAYDRLVQEALSRLIDEKLADVGAWED